jgi:hypothetical protein
VCSDHFLVQDYTTKGVFGDDGRFAFIPTNLLLPTAVPSVFNFSGYNTSATDAPMTYGGTGDSGRTARLAKRMLASEKEVFTISATN